MNYFRDKDITVRLGETGVKGANSFDCSYSYPRSKINVLGQGLIGQNYNGIYQGDGSIGALVLDGESSLYNTFVNNSGVIPSGVMGATDVNFSFTSGYINEYSLNGGVSSFISDSISFNTFHKIESSSGITPQDNIGSTGIRSKDITLSGSSVLEVEHAQSFSYSISTSWKPNYIAGSHFPVEVSNIDGYSIVFNMDFLANEFNFKKVLDDFERATESGVDLTITIGKKCFDPPLVLKIPKAHIEDENLSSSVGGTLGGSIKFVTFLKDLEDLS